MRLLLVQELHFKNSTLLKFRELQIGTKSVILSLGTVLESPGQFLIPLCGPHKSIYTEAPPGNSTFKKPEEEHLDSSPVKRLPSSQVMILAFWD